MYEHNQEIEELQNELLKQFECKIKEILSKPQEYLPKYGEPCEVTDGNVWDISLLGVPRIVRYWGEENGVKYAMSPFCSKGIPWKHWRPLPPKYGIKLWVGREKTDGSVYLYLIKPTKIDSVFYRYDGKCIQISSNLFPELTHENSPMEIII